MTLDSRLLRVHEKLENELPYYASECLLIKSKVGKMVPFRFNRAQLYLHGRIEDQRRRTGRVRIIIVKGRQQGCSTYVAARYFHKAVWNPNLSVYILSHEKKSTDNLFAMVKRFREKLPEPMQPTLDTSNTQELEFANKSHYRVGTAGQGTTGRSQTNQLFHGSEVAYYVDVDNISSGVLETIADMDDTEIILESTANGVGNFFHKSALDAIAGRGEYELVFIPWYWQAEYRAKVPPGFEFTEEERTIQAQYKLDDQQLFWRHNKIIKLKSESMFKQEYPFTPQEAFLSSGTPLLKGDLVTKASKTGIKDPKMPLILGVDPAKDGDRTVIVHRRGRQVIEVEKWTVMDPMTLAGLVAQRIERHADNFGQAFIDVGMGYGTISRLKELGYGPEVTAVDFGSKALQSEVFLNKRAEMAGSVRDWFEEEQVGIPPNDEFITDLISMPDFKTTSNSRFKLISKDDIRKEFGMSPDMFDAMCLTFAFPVASKIREGRRNIVNRSVEKGSPLQTLNRCRKMRKSRHQNSGVRSWDQR